MEAFLESAIRCYYNVEVPAGRNRPERLPLLLALHGYQGNKDSMMEVARKIASGRMVVISLQGPNQFFIRHGKNDLTNPKRYPVGFGWGTSWRMDEAVALHHKNIHGLIRLAAGRFLADARRVFLLGFSQAVAYNYRYVFTHPREILGAIAVCGGVPGDWEQNPAYRSARTHVLHIAAAKDAWYSRERNFEFKRQLATRAASLDFRFYRSPHRFPRNAIPHIRRWIDRCLDGA